MSIEIAPAALLPMALVIGLLIGSFLNVVIHRVPEGLSIVSPPSHCPSCRALIAPWDNVPLLSYAWLRGRCRSCGVAISLRYPAIELLTGLVFAVIAMRYGASVWTFVYCLFAAALVVVPASSWHQGSAYFDALVRSAAGAVVGAGVLWSVAFLHARISVAMGRQFEHWPGEGVALPRPGEADYWLWFPGLGLGDVKLLAMIGAVLGPVGVLDSILASSLVGLVLGGLQAGTRGALASPFGFAPAIAVGATASLFLPQLWLLQLFA